MQEKQPLKKIEAFKSIDDLIVHEKADLIHHEKYSKMFELAWSEIHKRVSSSEKSGMLAVRIVASHIGTMLYFSSNIDRCQILVERYEKFLMSSNRLDELSVFKEHFLDVPSRVAESIYQTYMESKGSRNKSKEDSVLAEIKKMYLKLPLNVIVEISMLFDSDY